MKKVKNVFKEYPIDVGIDSYTVGIKSHRGLVKKIEYFTPDFEGDQHYCDVKFEEGSMLRIFRPDTIEFEEVDNE